MLTKPPPTTVLLGIIKYYTQVKITGLARAVPFPWCPSQRSPSRPTPTPTPAVGLLSQQAAPPTRVSASISDRGTKAGPAVHVRRGFWVQV